MRVAGQLQNGELLAVRPETKDPLVDLGANHDKENKKPSAAKQPATTNERTVAKKRGNVKTDEMGIDSSDSETMPLELPVAKKRATAKSESAQMHWKCHPCGLGLGGLTE